MRSTCFCASSREVPFRSRTKNFPWRTSFTAAKPSDARACWMVCPWGSRTVFFGITQTCAFMAALYQPQRHPCGAKLAKQLRFFLDREERVRKTHFRKIAELARGEPHLGCGRLVLFSNRGVEHGGVVGGKHHGNFPAVQFRQRVLLDFGLRPAELLGQRARAKIAGWTDLQRDFSLREQPL